MRIRIRVAVLAGLAAAAVGTAVAVTTPASAASLTEVTGFGANPTNLRMHLYVPDNVGARPPILVAAHYCTGTGPAFYSGTQFASLADQYKFIVIYPSATRSGQCWDVSSPGALSRGGNSDPVGIMSMVNYVVQRHGGDANRVYATGASSGAMMTNVLLGVYPDVFKAGASFMGVPFACFATTDGSSWNSQCANGQRIMTAQQWGDLVRNAYPGYNGARPRMQIFHGTADNTLRYPNFAEQIKQWTNVHGLSQTPTFTDTPQSGWTRTRYGSTGLQAPVEAISLQGVGHNLPLSGQALMAIRFFGLDTTSPTTPPTTRPTTPPTTRPTTPPTTRPTTPPTTPPTTTPPTTAPTTAPTTPPTTGPTGGGCRVGYVVNAWNTGLTAQVTITNTGSSTINGWALTFTLPGGQTIASGWNATYSPTSGAVTARNMSYNGTLAPGGSTSIGFQANHTGNSGPATGFALNGAPCS